MKIKDNIHLITGNAANVYLINGKDGLILIDSGLSNSFEKISEYFRQMDCSLGEIKHIVITHADDDHYGGLYRLKNATNARVYASGIEADAIRRGDLSRELNLGVFSKILFRLIRILNRTKPVMVDQIISAGMSIADDPNTEVIDSTGHTPGHISIYMKREKVLFAGDSLRQAKDGRITLSPAVSIWDEKQALASMERQLRLNIEIICPGHGPVIFMLGESQ